MNIAVTDARGLFTKMLIDVYKERIAPLSFLRSFFPAKESFTKELSIEVQRGTEKIAVDVERGTEGNRNSFSKSTEKIFVPPYYHEYFDITHLDLYDRLMGSTGEIDDAMFTRFMEDVADKLRMVQDKIDRAYERQCAQVLETGIVTLTAGVSIDFKRKAASLRDLSGTPWTGANDPYAQLIEGATFIRTKGKTRASIFDLIMGDEVLPALYNNAKFLARGPLTNINLDSTRPPQRDAIGGVLHGEITFGAYKGRIWTYPEFYDDSTGTATPYLNPKKIIMLPDSPRFVLGFAAVPQLLTGGGTVPKKGQYLVNEFVDQRKATHDIDIKSAGVAIPVAVDQIWTAQVVG